jgi:threonine 3-dehydrogenase
MFVRAINAEFGAENVIATDVDPREVDFGGAKSMTLDVTDTKAIEKIVRDEGITYIVHLAAILSALGEQNVDLAYRVNVDGTTGIFNVAKDNNCKVYMPSTIGVFGGDNFNRELTTVDSVLQPTTIYGVSKVFNELLGTYYHDKFGVDFRSLRYPGVISSFKYAFNGTTDYATEMFFEVLEHGKYECWLREDTYLPMIYIDDCIRATIQILKANEDDLSRRVYNLAGKSFCPGDLAKSVNK